MVHQFGPGDGASELDALGQRMNQAIGKRHGPEHLEAGMAAVSPGPPRPQEIMGALAKAEGPGPEERQRRVRLRFRAQGLRPRRRGWRAQRDDSYLCDVETGLGKA